MSNGNTPNGIIRESAQQSARLLVRTLQGGVVDGDDAGRREGDDDDDASSRRLRRARGLSAVYANTLPARIRAAIAEDTVDVVLNDGSAMPLAQAEKHLAIKEERGVYPPLRAPIAAACARARDRFAERCLVVDAEGLHLLDEAHQGGVASSRHIDDLKALRAFIAASAPLAAPALEVLSVNSDAPIGDALTLARALDRPLPALTNDQHALELVRLTRPSVGDAAITRAGAPRGLLGHVVDDGERRRIFWGPFFTFGRYGALVAGVGALYGMVLGDSDDNDDDDEGANDALNGDVKGDGADDEAVALARGLGAGLGLMLQAPPVWRALGVSGAQAQALWRERIAALVIQARLRALVAVAVVDVALAQDPDDDGPSRHHEQRAQLRDQVRAAARGACGIDVGQGAADALMAPPWPDGRVDLACDDALVRAATDVAAAAAAAIALRDAFDDSAPLRARGLLGAIPALRGPSSAPSSALAALLAEVC